ncbi:hypothetical protein ACFVYP_37045 [Kitasatospora sp. NPDC058201]|uniref:hypothetical protein n=1 Tax=unclassified Kitasatospora TaxID=2633591 RepID=UPI00365FE015
MDPRSGGSRRADSGSRSRSLRQQNGPEYDPDRHDATDRLYQNAYSSYYGTYYGAPI